MDFVIEDAFIKRALSSERKAGQSVSSGSFICPRCEGDSFWSRGDNNHLRAWCKGCDAYIHISRYDDNLLRLLAEIDKSKE